MQALTPIEQQIAACFDKLQMLQFTVFKHHWDSLNQATTTYESEIDKLNMMCQSSPQLAPQLLQHFQHLYTQQRRVMRAIHHAQQMTLDDTQATQKGLNRLTKTKNFAEKDSLNGL